jgi:hypothetical protein
MRRLILCFAALALVTAACGDDDDTASDPAATEEAASSTSEGPTSTTSTTSTSAPSATSTTSASSTTPEETTTLAQSCDSPDGFTISHPEDWAAVSECGQFGPEPIDEPTPNTDERTGVVNAFIDPVAFEQVAEPTDGDRERREATVDGRPAIRVAGEQSGTGLYPEGTEYVRWIVDVSDGGGPATLFVDAYDLGYDIEFDRAVNVLDAMVQSLAISGR